MQAFGLTIALALAVAVSASPLSGENHYAQSDEGSVSIPVFSDYKPGDKCPAEHFSDGCNTCVCIGGFQAACTLKFCGNSEDGKRHVRGGGSSVVIPVFPHYKAGDKCPAEHFSDGCNTCVCTDGINAACTKKFCVNPEGGKRHIRGGGNSVVVPVFPDYKTGDKCPAEYFSDGCNNCVCIGGFQAACTLKLCVNSEGGKRHVRGGGNSVVIPVFPHYKAGDKCPAEHFSDGCNTCVCNDGFKAVCTLKFCINSEGGKRHVRDGGSSVVIPVFPDYKTGDKCPAEYFSDGCNNCVCIGGFQAACTLKFCGNSEVGKRHVRGGGSNVVIPVFPNYKAGDKCPAEHFSDGCNTCVCTDGITAACTKKFCVNSEG